MQKVYTDSVPHLVNALQHLGAVVKSQSDQRATVVIEGNGQALTLDIVHKGSSPYDADFYDDREPGN